MPARLNSAFFTSSASSCCAATLFADNGTGFELPGTRPYHLLDFFVTFVAPGVPDGTVPDLTNRAPGVSLAQGRPFGSIQQSYSQCCTTVILNRLLGIADSCVRRSGRPGQGQPEVGAKP